MTRIAYRRPEEMTERARELTQERGNLNVYRALANADKVFTGWMEAGRAALTSPVLPFRLRELVVLRTAYLMDCRYELGQHNDIARTAGLSDREIKALTCESDWEKLAFDDTERAVVRLTSELVTTRNVSARAVRSRAHRFGLRGDRRSSDADRSICGPGSDAQRARRRSRRKRTAGDARTAAQSLIVRRWRCPPSIAATGCSSRRALRCRASVPPTVLSTSTMSPRLVLS